MLEQLLILKEQQQLLDDGDIVVLDNRIKELQDKAIVNKNYEDNKKQELQSFYQQFINKDES